MRKFEITVTKRQKSDAEATADAALTCGPDNTADAALTCGPDDTAAAALTCGPDGPGYTESAGDSTAIAREADLSPLDDS